MDIKQTVGKKIQKYRKQNKLTQEQLAELINVETISLSRIETGKNYPTSENLAKIAKTLNVEPHEFFTLEKEKTANELYNEILKSIQTVHNDTKKLATINKIIKAILQ